MNYYTSRIFDNVSFEQILEAVPPALKEEGFGILTEIDVAKVMKEKIDKDIRPYKILGACNPHFAYHALQAENKIGTMLPCNVVVQEISDHQVEVSVVDPIASMSAIENPALGEVAGEVRDKLKNALTKISV
jgi:uncharacterized protein (DUF302 family)